MMEDTAMATRICPQCGVVNAANVKFCDGCGISLTQRLQVPTQVIAPPIPPAAAAIPAAPVGVLAPVGGQIAVSGTIKTGMPISPGLNLGDGGRYVIDKPLGKGGMGSILDRKSTRLNSSHANI